MNIKIFQILKRHMFSIFLCTVFFSTISSTTLVAKSNFTIEDMSVTATISTDTLNVRSGPGKDYDSIGQVSSADTIFITGQASTGWYRINYDGTDGFISDSYVSISSQETPSLESSEYIEGDSQKEPINYTLLIIIGIIIIVIISIIITTAKTIHGGSDDEEYAEEDQDYVEQNNKIDDSHIVKEDDYRIYIDPIYFKDEITTSPPSNDTPSTTSDSELEDALSKLNALQQEIERLKEKRN